MFSDNNEQKSSVGPLGEEWANITTDIEIVEALNNQFCSFLHRRILVTFVIIREAPMTFKNKGRSNKKMYYK